MLLKLREEVYGQESPALYSWRMRPSRWVLRCDLNMAFLRDRRWA